MKDPRPIICVHKGDNRHLRYIIAQTKESNPSSEFIFLGNSTNSYYSGIKHVDIKNYFEDANKLAKIYRHNNNHQPHRELFFIQRWLILNEFLQKNNINKAFNIDSDILIFQKIEVIRAMYSSAKFTLIHAPNCIPHGGSSFIDSKDITQKLSDLIFEIYENNAYMEELLHQHPAGIGEMTILHEFKSRYPDDIINTIEPVNGKAMQSCMTYFPGMHDMYEVKDGWCKINWIKDIPHAKLAEEPRSTIQLTVLHMHGPCKAYIVKYIRIKNLKVRLTLYFNALKYAIFRGPLKYINKYCAKFFNIEPFQGLWNG